MARRNITSIFLLVFAAVFLEGASKPSSKVSPQAKEYDFRGTVLGVSLGEFRMQAFPDTAIEPTAKLICSADEEAKNAKGGVSFWLTSEEEHLGVIECRYYVPSKILDGLWDESLMSVSTRGVAKSVEYMFVPDPQSNIIRLYSIMVTAYVNAEPGAMDGLTGKFGKPTTSVNDTIQNRMGAKFDHTLAIWANPSSMIRFESPSEDVDTMTIVYSERRLSNYVDAQEKKMMGSNSDKM